MTPSLSAPCDARPVFWQRQPRMPLPVMRLLRSRLAAAMKEGRRRSLLAWPTILGAPRLLEQHPEGIPWPLLMEKASNLLSPLGFHQPEDSWSKDLAAFPDSATLGETGWLPHGSWAPMSALVSLRSGVMLLALMGNPEVPGFGLQVAATLFNSALYHECHDVLEPLWEASRGHTKAGLQGLILLAAGFHHQQLHNLDGMSGLWEDACSLLVPRAGELTTPWGVLDYSAALEAATARLEWLAGKDRDSNLAPLWEMPRPTWELL
nr:DUF309 domain-containing protein [uncultured Holophaga sp.]